MLDGRMAPASEAGCIVILEESDTGCILFLNGDVKENGDGVQCRECISRFCGLCSGRTDIRTSYAGANVLLLKEDGMVTLGTSLEIALHLAHLAEETARESFNNGGEVRN